MPLPEKKPETSPPSWKIKLLYDGECPLCRREVTFLQKKDGGQGLIAFVDIAEESYSPWDHGGIDYETAMGRIHAVLSDGTIIRDLEVFRQVYEVLGMGWIYAATKLPIIEAIANWLYSIWAKLRFPLTRRPDLKTLVAEKSNQRCRLKSFNS